MSDIQKLRQQAAKARRLAGGVNDSKSKDALEGYAAECETNALALEERDRVPERGLPASARIV